MVSVGHIAIRRILVNLDDKETLVMMRSASNLSSSKYATLVHQMMLEDVRYDQNERRSSIRETLVRPTLIRSKGESGMLLGISRNISSQGICIIVMKRIEEMTNADIFVHRLGAEPAVFSAECRWTKPFGEGWYLTGWHFLDGKPGDKPKQIMEDF
jgi:hypothetical protein